MSASEDLTNINAAITKMTAGQQIKELTVNGKKIVFQNMTVNELLALKRDCEIRLSVENSRRRVRARTLSGGKGL